MAKPRVSSLEMTYPLRSAARLTGLSPQLLRAWESRHGVVEPARTQGGTRRYRASDLERLRLLKSATDAGHRIRAVAGLSNPELEQLLAPPGDAPSARLEGILGALDSFDAAEAQRLLALQLSALGALAFAREIATPLVREIGVRWASQRMRIASEHLATGVLRSMLGSALQPSASALRGARIVFGTLTGERHELGLLIAALASMGAGANPVYLGAEVPIEDLLHAVSRCDAAALSISIVAGSPVEVSGLLEALRAELPASVHLWVGGASAGAVTLAPGIDHIESFEQLEQRIGLLAFEPPRKG
jgi:DNA-binding transcriptional MerR regulator/methylmalonyl-CoA mutase cobalamin-binding subunit